MRRFSNQIMYVNSSTVYELSRKVDKNIRNFGKSLSDSQNTVYLIGRSCDILMKVYHRCIEYIIYINYVS